MIWKSSDHEGINILRKIIYGVLLGDCLLRNSELVIRNEMSQYYPLDVF